MLGIQIYTVRALMQNPQDAENTLKSLMDMGYECIQLAGGIESIRSVADAAKKTGMKVIGILTNINTFRTAFEETVAIAKELGARDLGISGNAKTESEARELVIEANEFAKKTREAGFSFSYHNHSHEFLKTECGLRVMDILLEGFDKELIDLMPDTYWLQHGGVDVRDFIETNKDRITLLHLKDMKRVPDGVTFAECGEGNLNMHGIIETAKKCNIKDFIVEQDICDGDPLVSARISYENLKELI